MPSGLRKLDSFSRPQCCVSYNMLSKTLSNVRLKDANYVPRLVQIVTAVEDSLGDYTVRHEYKLAEN